MLEPARCLSARHLRAVDELELRVVRADGGRLKLEWGMLRARGGQTVEGCLWWEDDHLLGFLGLYAIGPPTVELTGMVDPAARRRGIATAMLDAALEVCRERRFERALLVTPGGSGPGRAFALSRDAELEHSEHALVLLDSPADGPTDPRIALRPASPPDAIHVSRLLAVAFGSVPADLLDRLADDSTRTLVADLDGAVVGTLRVSRDQDDGGVYGFAVDPAWQGRGIGRDILRRACHQLRSEGVKRIGLEVAVENDRALGLYSSLGFTQLTTENYYALPLPA
jgi:ribosomal protein S18 acetylase RimI-like enzyme